MPRDANRPYEISDVRAIRLLASPLRQALLDRIAARGPSTVAELSSELRRPADRLYYHVKLLLRAGLLLEIDGAAAAGRPEARFDVPGRPLRIRYDLGAATNRRAVSRVVSGVLRSARRDFERAQQDRSARVAGPRRELWAGRVEAWLAPADLEALNTLLRETLAMMERPAPGEGRGEKLYQLTWALSPTGR